MKPPFTVRIRNNSKLKDLRKKLRRASTPAERALWAKLRNHRLEKHKFYRQYGLGNYVLDFYCPKAKLAIELDGGHHALEEQIEYDQQRSQFIEHQGIRTIRFWNRQIMDEMDGVVEEIYRALGG